MEIPSDAILALLSSCTFFCMLDRFVYRLALGAITVIRPLPLAVRFLFGQCVGALLCAILPRYRKLARENLSTPRGNQESPREIRRMTFLHFVSLGANGMCALKIATLAKETIFRIAALANSEGTKRNILSGGGVVLAITHMGNWELYAQVAFQRPETTFGTVYQALHGNHASCG